MTGSAMKDVWAGARRLMPADGEAPTSAVLLLHGLGSNADDLISLAPILSRTLRGTVFLSPNAPFACDMGGGGYQWFSLQQWSPETLWQGVRQAAPFLEQMIEGVSAEFGLAPGRIALLGFSQGTMMALHVAPRLREPVAAVVGFSGALVGPEYLGAETVSRPPVLLVHGQADPVVPFAAMAVAQASLASAGFRVEVDARPHLPHSIDEEGIDHAARFLSEVFATAG